MSIYKIIYLQVLYRLMFNFQMCRIFHCILKNKNLLGKNIQQLKNKNLLGKTIQQLKKIQATHF